MEKKSGNCDLSESQTEWQKVTFRNPFHGKVYNVKNFLAEVCRTCDEKYFHGEDLEKLDRQILKRESVQELEFIF